MRSATVVLMLGGAVIGCDTGDERPLTLAEQLAGSWELVEVVDGSVKVTDAFQETVGTLRLEFESVGCCARTATYRVTVTRPDGDVIETVNPYSPNEPNQFIVFNFLDVAAVLYFDFELSGSQALTLTATTSQEDLVHWGVDYPFRRVAGFEFRRR
jgi:hypothetical protein